MTRRWTTWLAVMLLAGCSPRGGVRTDDDDAADDDDAVDDDDAAPDDDDASAASEPPVVLEAYADGEWFPTGDPVPLVLRVDDPDTPLSRLSVQWTEGGVDIGAPIVPEADGLVRADLPLPDGERVLIARVTDGTGAEAEALLVFYVGPVVFFGVPECVIDAPAAGARVPDDAVELVGFVTDEQDGPELLTAEWAIDGARVGDGAPEADGRFATTWVPGAAGQVTARLSGWDSEANRCDAEVQFEVCASVPWYEDTDNDGYGDGAPVHACDAPGAGWTQQDGDCEPTDPAINPGTPETCDGLDENCNGTADENVCFNVSNVPATLLTMGTTPFSNFGWTYSEFDTDTGAIPPGIRGPGLGLVDGIWFEVVTQADGTELGVFAFPGGVFSSGVPLSVAGSRGLVILSSGNLDLQTSFELTGGDGGGTWTPRDGGFGGGGAGDGGAGSLANGTGATGGGGAAGGLVGAVGVGPGAGGGGGSHCGGGGGGAGGTSVGGPGTATSPGTGGSGGPIGGDGGPVSGAVAASPLTFAGGGAGGIADGAGANEGQGGGAGGGSVQISVDGTLTLTGPIISRGGAGGTGSGGAGGGGAGGMILLEAADITIGSYLSAGGGYGGGGGNNGAWANGGGATYPAGNGGGEGGTADAGGGAGGAGKIVIRYLNTYTAPNASFDPDTTSPCFLLEQM